MKIVKGWVQVNDGASVEVDKDIAINANATEDAFFIVVDDIVLIDADELAAMVKRLIELTPTVDPVQHGRWVDDYNAEENPFFRKGWKCSVCGSRNTYGKPKHCPNCGAQMDGESNET